MMNRRFGVVTLFFMFVVFQGKSAVAQVKTEAPYQSPDKLKCNAEFEKDVVWQAELKDRFRANLHEEESGAILRNNKHVVAAYSLIWVLLIGFLFYLYIKQQSVSKEISHLENELQKAIHS